MKFVTVQGRQVNKSISKYLVDWSLPCRSKAQFRCKQFFKDFWQSSVVVEEMPAWGSLLKCDLINLSLGIAVELDGLGVHDKFNPFYHKTKIGFLNSMKRDIRKEEFFEKNGWVYLRILDSEIKDLSYNWILEKFDIDILEKYN